MIERVAALMSKRYGDAAVDWRKIVREVIEAMREPTQEMDDALTEDVGEYPNMVWPTMIEAALRG